jgi:hypothetical protein
MICICPQVAYIRFGTAGHLSFLWCGLVCNAIVSACILIGAGSVVTALTGMNAYASLFLIPVGVAIYVATGYVRYLYLINNISKPIIAKEDYERRLFVTRRIHLFCF